MSVLAAVGDNCLDAFLNKDLLTVGGNALNVAVQWHRNGWQSRYFGVVGDDHEGAVIRDEIVAAGLDPADCEVRLGGETAVTLLEDNAGDRRFLLESFGVGEHYMPTPDAYAQIATAGWIHLGTNANPSLVERLAADRLPFSVDLSTTPFALPLAAVPLVFASGPDSAGKPALALLAALRDAGAAKAVVTCGPGGAFFDDGGGPRHATAIPVDVVDTCGAGDSFIAAFIAAHCIAGEGAAAALASAAAKASVTCTHLGGFPQTPRRIPPWLPAKYAAAIRSRGA